MPDLLRDEVVALTSSPTWVRIKAALKAQQDALKEGLFSGATIDRGSIERTAMNTIETSAEIRMYDDFINLDELLFGPKEET